MLLATLPAPPAQVAGPWEALVAPGEVAGVSLQLMTNANGTVRSVRVDTYLRKAGKTTSTWWSSVEAGSFTMRGRELRFRQSRGAPGCLNIGVGQDGALVLWAAFGGYSSDHYGNGLVDPSHPRRPFAWTRMSKFTCRP